MDEQNATNAPSPTNYEMLAQALAVATADYLATSRAAMDKAHAIGVTLTDMQSTVPAAEWSLLLSRIGLDNTQAQRLIATAHMRSTGQLGAINTSMQAVMDRMIDPQTTAN